MYKKIKEIIKYYSYNIIVIQLEHKCILEGAYELGWFLLLFYELDFLFCFWFVTHVEMLFGISKAVCERTV